jgi:hypothetical protein
MSAADLLLTVRGQDDRWLSMTPDRTYFEAKYQPRVNRSRETYEIPFDNQVTFDSTGRCTIPVKGDYMTRMTLRTVLPPIYPTVEGQYVFPTPSSEVGATVYANMGLTLVVADGVTLTANTAGNHYFSIGAQVTLVGTAYVIFDLDGTYTITGIPTANSFTCSTVLAGISYNGTASSPGIECGDIISYFSTTNSNLWVNNVTNKTWQITGGSNVGTSWTFTTSAPSNFPVGSQVLLNLTGSGILNQTYTVTASSDAAFTVTKSNSIFVITGGTQVYSADNGLTWNFVISPLTAIYWEDITYGNGTFVMVGQNSQAYSVDNGQTWIPVTYPLSGYWRSTAFGNGVFVTIKSVSQARSTDNGLTWSFALSPITTGDWFSVAYGNGVFVMVGDGCQAYSTDNGQTWTSVASPLGGTTWYSVAYGNGVFVMSGYYQAYSTDNGITWNLSAPFIGGQYASVAYGNGVFVAVFPLSGFNGQAYSTDNGITWTYASSPLGGSWSSVAYGNGVFVMLGFSGVQSLQAYSTDNGLSWNLLTSLVGGNFSRVTYGEFIYTSSSSDSVSLVTPPLQLTDRVFSSDTYPSVSFQNASDAAFWGFDSREGLTYSLPATPPWTLTQSGWISGFLPPSTSTYDDSVAHKLCKNVRLLVGKQTIKEYSGEYIELQNDLLVPYENKAILKLMNGTLDQTQATVAREYYVNLPLGTKEIPLCALTHQHMSVEVDFDSYLNLSQNLNQGTGDFLDAKSYTTYDASTGILGGQPVNVQTTFSYQQYIFIVTYGGQFIIFDTTKNVDDPASYIVLSAFSGSSLFSQFCVLSGNLYIGLTNGQLARMIITELIQGNISSFVVNNYTPTIGSLTGTIVADFRYVYYTVSNTASSNVFVSKYDTTGVFTSPGSYTTVDFTKTFSSNVTGVYQTISTGTDLIILPQGTPGSLYTYQLNANVQSQWYLLDYSIYGSHVTEGVVIGSTLYFISDNFNILKYSNSTFTLFNYSLIFIANTSTNEAYSYDGKTWILGNLPSSVQTNIGYGNEIFIAVGSSQAYSKDNGVTWTYAATPLAGDWRSIVFGDGVFVMVGFYSQAYSFDNGITWTSAASPLGATWSGVSYGNGVFVTVGYYGAQQAYSSDNGITWTYASSPLGGTWSSVAYGNGVFVMVGDSQGYSTDNGLTWTSVASPLGGFWYSVTYGNGVFVMAGYNSQAYSTDYGLTWNYSNVQIPEIARSVVYADGIFVLVTYDSQAYSTDDGLTWNAAVSPAFGYWGGVAVSIPKFTIPGDGLRNLIVMGNYIYCSTNNVAVRIDTTKDLSTAAAYKFPAPLPTNQYVLANGPRYVYMFAQGDNTATNIVEFDPYGPDTTFKASILVDYESLPPEVPKPDKALLGLVQTQRVTDMNYMNIKGPVKELWITGAPDSANVFQYSNLAARSTLELTGEQIVTNDVGTRTFLNTIEPFETHTSMPIRNVSLIPFEFDPESDIPNGTINFSRIRDQVLSANAQTVWASNYNLLAIQGGIGGLIFNS